MKREERVNRLKSLLGARFGRLVVTEITEKVSEAGNTIYGLKCLCDCGKVTFPKEEKLRSKDTLSCGCLRREKMRKAFFARRGNKKTEEMTIWDWR